MSVTRPNRPDHSVGFNRRQFLTVGGTGLLAAALPGGSRGASTSSIPGRENSSTPVPQGSPGAKKKIPIGVPAATRINGLVLLA